jgi:hypothetical protein
VGLLIAAVGLCIGVAGWQQQITLPILVLAVASSGFLMVVDVVYVAKGVIARIYLLDAAVEAALIVAWLIAWSTKA